MNISLFKRKWHIYAAFRLIILLLSITFYSCRTLKPVATEIIHYSGEEVYREIMLRDPGIETYSAGRVIINIVDEDVAMNLRGSLRIRKDSAIMVSISAIAGIEAGRVLLTRDSVKLLDRINNKYFIGSYAEAEKVLPVPVSFDIIQSIFFASTKLLSKEFELIKTNGELYTFNDGLLSVRLNSSILTGARNQSDDLKFSFNENFLTSSVDLVSSHNNLFASLRYNSYGNYSGIEFPEDIEVYYVSHNLPLTASIRISRIEIDKKITFPFSVPARYNPFLR